MGSVGAVGAWSAFGGVADRSVLPWAMTLVPQWAKTSVMPWTMTLVPQRAGTSVPAKVPSVPPLEPWERGVRWSEWSESLSVRECQGARRWSMGATAGRALRMASVPGPLVPEPSGSSKRRSWQFKQPSATQKLVQGWQAGAEEGPSSPRGAEGEKATGDMGLAAGGEWLGDWGRG